VNGEAVISGLETQLGTEWQGDEFSVPLNIAYTYTQAEISSDNPTNGLLDGDLLKDVPENTFSARLGVEHSSGWNNYAVAKYVDEMCVAVGCNRSSSPQAKTDALFVVDYISRYSLNKNAVVYFKAENLFDEQKIVARTPDGARPNKPRSVMLGMTIGF
jgi:Fe(3+) dicitrate transport protein